jgi:hypothetical protein
MGFSNVCEGIIWIITHGASILDEVVKSRVHLNLMYKMVSIECRKETEEQLSKVEAHISPFIWEEEILRLQESLCQVRQ